MKTEIQIFLPVTTEENLAAIETEAETYVGLYVDMDDAPQRKYVKDKAAEITKIIKNLDRARIDESARYKRLVEAEAGSIKERLQEANKPFTVLIDEYKTKRAKELAAIKEIEDRKAMAVQIEIDHEAAIMEDKVRSFEKVEAEAAAKNQIELQRAAHDEAVRFAAENARQMEIERQAREEKAALAEIERRGNDKNHKARINNQIADILVGNGLSRDHAKIVVMLAAKKQLPNVSINY